MGFKAIYDEYTFDAEGENEVTMEHRIGVTGSINKGNSSRYKIPVNISRIEKVLSPICKERRQWFRRKKLYFIAGPVVGLSIRPDDDGFLASISLDQMIRYLENILHVKVTPFGGDSWEDNCVKVFNESKK